MGFWFGGGEKGGGGGGEVMVGWVRGKCSRFVEVLLGLDTRLEKFKADAEARAHCKDTLVQPFIHTLVQLFYTHLGPAFYTHLGPAFYTDLGPTL